MLTFLQPGNKYREKTFEKQLHDLWQSLPLSEVLEINTFVINKEKKKKRIIEKQIHDSRQSALCSPYFLANET